MSLKTKISEQSLGKGHLEKELKLSNGIDFWVIRNMEFWSDINQKSHYSTKHKKSHLWELKRNIELLSLYFDFKFSFMSISKKTSGELSIL